MTKENNFDLILRVVNAYDFDNGGPGTEHICWNTCSEPGQILPMINCNDLFYWGCADCERITWSNIDLLELTFQELEKLEENQNEGKGYKDWVNFFKWADSLFVARFRQQRPQLAYYKSFPEELKPLFDACGTEETQYGSEAYYDKIEEKTGKKLEWRAKHKNNQ